MALKIASAASSKVSPVVCRRPSTRSRAGETHAAHVALLVEQHFFRLRPGQQAHLIGFGDVLFVAGGAHVRRATAIHQIDIAGTEAGHLHGHVDRGVAGAEDDAALGQRQLREVIGLTQFADVVGGGEQAGGVFVGQAELFAGVEAEAEEHRVELLMQFAEGQVVAEFLPVTNLDAADLQEEIQFLLRVVVDQFVLGDPVFVEAASLSPALRKSPRHARAWRCDERRTNRPARHRPRRCVCRWLAARWNGCSVKCALSTA